MTVFVAVGESVGTSVDGSAPFVGVDVVVGDAVSEGEGFGVAVPGGRVGEVGLVGAAVVVDGSCIVGGDVTCSDPVSTGEDGSSFPGAAVTRGDSVSIGPADGLVSGTSPAVASSSSS